MFHAANMKQHQKKCFRAHACLVCGEKTHNEFYCSKSCSARSNNKNGSIGYTKYRKNKNIVRKRTYRDICFDHWVHRCALCPWEISLDVHHIDDDHSNDEPINLIPLCQNHHTMTRMVEHRDAMRIALQELSRDYHKTNRCSALVRGYAGAPTSNRGPRNLEKCAMVPISSKNRTMLGTSNRRFCR